MASISSQNQFARLFFIVITTSFALHAYAQTLPSESPQEFKPTNYGLEYDRRDVMIPMRDGVKLHTVIIVPKSLIDANKLDAKKREEHARSRRSRRRDECRTGGCVSRRSSSATSNRDRCHGG